MLRGQLTQHRYLKFIEISIVSFTAGKSQYRTYPYDDNPKPLKPKPRNSKPYVTRYRYTHETRKIILNLELKRYFTVVLVIGLWASQLEAMMATPGKLMKTMCLNPKPTGKKNEDINSGGLGPKPWQELLCTGRERVP